MTKTIRDLNELLKKKIKKAPSGSGWINPFSESKEENVFKYPSIAVDDAIKFFTRKTIGEERRVKHLGEEWRELT